MRELLVRGASVHARNRANNTPLYLAEKMGNAECVRLLREAGAHLWLDNDLKREGLNSAGPASQNVSRGGSPEVESHGEEGKEGGERPTATTGTTATMSTKGAEGGEVGGDGGVNNTVGDGGREVQEAEPARVLLTGDKGKIVG